MRLVAEDLTDARRLAGALVAYLSRHARGLRHDDRTCPCPTCSALRDADGARAWLLGLHDEAQAPTEGR